MPAQLEGPSGHRCSTTPYILNYFANFTSPSLVVEVLAPQGAPVLEEPAALHQGWDVLSELFVALVQLLVSTALLSAPLPGWGTQPHL